MIRSVLALMIAFPAAALAQVDQSVGDFEDLFRQFEGEVWPTPDEIRPAHGAPGPDYWQQQVDYDIDVSLNEDQNRVIGGARITYTNNSPYELEFLWFLMDQNRFRRDSWGNLTSIVSETDQVSQSQAHAMMRYREWEGGFNVYALTDERGVPMDYTIVDTLMRIDLDEPLASGDSISFSIAWDYNLVEENVIRARAGYQCFEEEIENGDCIYLVAQWFPRAAAFTDYEGWHNLAFLGSGEFTLEFGNYEVDITVPADFIVSATGELQNPEEVLTEAQRERLATAMTSEEPVFIVTPEEALENEREGTAATATWRFAATNVRDFAFAGSRKFIWDALGVQQEGEGDAPDVVLAMSFYPNENEPIWSAWSTRVIEHTLDVYSGFSFPYPYPTAQSVSGPVGGMEYPMITFNGPRTVRDEDGNITYSRGTKRFLVGVIAHEIGHIYFPMTVNSDERQWAWMDEGINSFLDYMAQLAWEENYPSTEAEPDSIIPYMISEDHQPIMTQPDSVRRLGPNAYAKPATALVILRETILGRELFDEAFRTYSRRWRFRRPTPYDFFRTMEEVSGHDLDWFWRGWFYSTDHVDLGISNIVQGTINTEDPEIENALEREEANAVESMTVRSNREAGYRTYSERNPEVRDYYTINDAHTVTEREREAYERLVADLDEWEAEFLNSGLNLYFMTFRNDGGVVMPVILDITFTDGETEHVRIPAQIWRRHQDEVIWPYLTEREILRVELDPLHEIADADRSDNVFPPQIQRSRIELYRSSSSTNMLQDQDLTVGQGSLETRPENEGDDD
ncbi:M1 family metallopeptidase [Hyphobacterium sp. HN65]|uniref:M1 family metallopeptidase n=1 Tax=Hyphobacterium lacteum TaxID=3116575 RepID=A0ABU7LTE2_9PROT|nr:M1 family metallopeptidase [Hyphobacterium sp. HN65]MEE2527187.1 M1 family metallopeptidase [Hyphobacterium sp. HN65]